MKYKNLKERYMDRFKLFHKDMTLCPIYIDLDDSLQDSVGLGIITSVHNIFGISFLDSPFSTVIYSIKNSVRRKYD